ncbi:MAG TPA: hypothetical protein VJI75_06865, partial [Candidatus Nanoarchaeia archaeon]|nr:hypothetical protein [Candidatus Nanoarchaeia archaeon]
MLLLSGCASTVKELKQEGTVGDKVSVKGTVVESENIKIGELSGFVLQDETGSLPVQSEVLPAKGDEVSVKGELKRSALFGTYIIAEKVK